MSRQCAGLKRDGSRCTATVTGASDYCWHHDPANSEARKRHASRAGRGSGSREIRGLKTELSNLVREVRSGDIATGTAVVLVQITNARLRCLEQERRIKETEELEARIGALETARERGLWGA